ncbi:hypothetical protein I0C86_27175 [Plantactinospora sp. S1510]|uniref:RNA polymerase sigma-70 region 2 domain-containing protein n=1 Tax=Plantactinospora alkalitolerans TaxID=2789879 RepID=A0ABS0H2B3_9ACTN|nr:hypothetical protein [Plantactinospora alkalitolerans]
MTFDEFVTTRGPSLVRLARLLSGDRHRAEDLVQDVLARAYVHWRRISATGRPDMYVRQMLVNANRSWWRLSRNRELPYGDSTHDPHRRHPGRAQRLHFRHRKFHARRGRGVRGRDDLAVPCRYSGGPTAGRFPGRPDAAEPGVSGVRGTHDEHSRPVHDRDINRRLAPIDTAFTSQWSVHQRRPSRAGSGSCRQRCSVSRPGRYGSRP